MPSQCFRLAPAGSVRGGSYPELAPSVSGRIQAMDGLRAIAVVLVIGFHLWPETLPGGFVGVDIFFVLSGFLITTRLAVELQTTGRIDLAAFWRRRARRLVPALVLVVVASTAIASMVDRNLLVGIGRQVVGAFSFSTNWVEVSAGTDYFADGESQLLNPLWSLAVEEQFYLLWPIGFVLVAARRVSRRRAAGMALVVAGVSALLMATLLTSAFAPTRVYYGTDTHIFGLMLGVALAYQMVDPASRFHHRPWLTVRAHVGAAALVLLAIVLTTLRSNAEWTYQGGLASASILTAIIVATLPGEPTILTNLLDGKPLRWIGQRSYGIYLWHWPVLLIVRAVLPARAPGAGTDVQTAVLALAVTAAVSAASYQYVESPIHRNGFRSTFADWRHAIVGDATDGADTVAKVRRFVVPTAFVALVVLAVAAVGTAPAISEAQRSVEEGQRMIALQAGTDAAQAAGTAVAVATRGSSSDAPAVPTTESSAATAAESTATATPGVEPTAATTEPSPSAPTANPQPQIPTVPVPVPEPTLDAPPLNTAPTPVSIPTAPQPSAQPPIDGTRIVGIGDSVLSGAAPAMFERFPGIRLVALASRQWGDAPAMVDDLVASGELRDIVVLNFGTNAGLIDDTRIQAARETFERIGPTRQVIVVTVVGISGWVPQSNANLAQVAAEFSNVTVVDWYSAVQNDPSLVHADRTHPNLRGIAVYADLIANAVR